MEPQFFDDQTFAKENFTQRPLKKGEYEGCTFVSCDFSDSDISGVKFSDCKFNECNLSLVKMLDTTFNDMKFKDCKMLGQHFDTCNAVTFSVIFDNCILDHSSFHKLKLKKIIFKSCKLEGVDFSECDLTNAIFDNCDLANAIFDHSILEKADFRTSFKFNIDPDKNRISKAKFSLSGVRGLLSKYDIDIS